MDLVVQLHQRHYSGMQYQIGVTLALLETISILFIIKNGLVAIVQTAGIQDARFHRRKQATLLRI